MRGNIKALTNEELKVINDKYQFELFEDNVVVVINNRKTLHNVNESFSLLLSSIERRRIKITVDAIQKWKDEFYGKYSLLEVQNAINTLVVTFQKITNENLKEQLKITRLKLDNLY